MDRKPPSRLSRRLLLPAALGIVALAAAHAVLWRHMASQLDDGWRAWVQLRRAQGWRVEHAPPLRGGWPFSATLAMERVRLEGATATLPGGVAIAADRLVLRVTMPRLDQLIVELPGQQRLRIGAEEFPFTADRLFAVVPLDSGALPSTADLTAERLRIGTPAGGVEVQALRLTAEGSASATEAEPALALNLMMDVVHLPATVNAAFGRRVEALSAELAFSGPLPVGRGPATRAEVWRDGGGTLEVKALQLRWGPVGAAAAATIALDDALQPMGAGTLRLTGAAAALDALAEAGLVNRRAAATARSVLPLLSRPSAENGAPEIEVPLTLEDRTLALARIPVVRFEALAWPLR